MTRQGKAHFYQVFPTLQPNPGTPVFTGRDDMKGFNEHRFYKGKLIEDWPDGITFFVKGDQETDYLVVENEYLVVGLHWVVVSERVRRIFEECQVKGAQFLPVHILVDDTER